MNLLQVVQFGRNCNDILKFAHCNKATDLVDDAELMNTNDDVSWRCRYVNWWEFTERRRVARALWTLAVS